MTVKLDTKWWIGLIVPAVITLVTGWKAEIAGQLNGWWTALTPWRFLFWGSVLWIAVWLAARFLFRPIFETLKQLKADHGSYNEIIGNLANALLSANERLQAAEMKLGIYPGDKKGV
jgi:hypothetical protein